MIQIPEQSIKKILLALTIYLTSLFAANTLGLDTTIFMVIAFAGIYKTQTLISIIITWWLYKVGMGILYTPLSSVAIRLLRSTPKQV